MRKQRCIPFAGLMLAFLLTPFLAQAQGVHAWEGSITIPTYKLGPADPNPPFPLVSRSPVYPYTMLDNLTDERVPQKYNAIYLENKYLKITVLPQLGGHVYSIYDKVAHREVLYRDHVIKYGLVGPRGAWIAGGMEFSFPYAHTTDTISPVESVLHQNPDGSATAVVGAIDWVSNMHWEVAITLRPDTARLEEGVTLFNSTPQNHLYLFWTNTAVKATDDAQYIYPMRETISDDPFAIVQSWPVWKGVDRSWYKNDPAALAIFGRNSHKNFFGVYYHQSNYGVVHVADFRQNPGKKFWTWGTARSGKIWDKILSDTDGSYNEIQSGRFYTQGSREFMNPRSVQQWTEYWYPVSDLKDGFVEATAQMAINADYLPGTDGQAQARILVSPVAEVTDATVIVKQGRKLLKQFSHVHFTPLKPATYTVPVQDLADARKNLDVEIQSAQGQTLLHWSAADPIDGNKDLVPAVGKPIKKRIDATPKTPVEQLYFHAVFLEKTGKEHAAKKAYDRVLERDPGYAPALLKEAWHSYREASFDQAQSYIQRAIERDNDNNLDPSIPYAEGVIYRAQGKLSLAKNAFWTSIHYGAALPAGPTLAPSYVELGEIAIHEGNYAKATELLTKAIGYNPNDAFSLADLAAAERLAGNKQSAAQHSAEAVRIMPLLPYALAENWQDGSAHDADWTKIISSDPENYLAIASWYHSLGAWESSDAVLHAAVKNLPASDVSPMIYYYLASNAQQEGNSRQAQENFSKAASSTSAAVFPNRLTDVAVLYRAIHQNPKDAQAQYALGNFLFARGRYREAADLWSKSLAEGFNNPVLLRNLGVYEWHVKKNLADAAGYYQRAIQLSPQNYRLYADLSDIYGQQGNFSAREKLFQSAPASVLDRDTVRARQILLLIEQSKPDAALALMANHHFKPWEGGVLLHTMYVIANMQKGKKALTDNQPAQAEQDFRKAMLYPEHLGTGEPYKADLSEQLYWLGNALAAQRKTAEATEAWRQATKHGSVYSALANKKLGQDEKAEQELHRIIQSAAEPDATAFHYMAAGLAERYSGNQANAREDFQHALEQDPQLWQARIELNSLK